MNLTEAAEEVRKIAKRCDYAGALSAEAVRACAEVYLANCDAEGNPRPRSYMRSGADRKQTNLTEIQWLLVRTPAFRRWFGKSVVVDENGDPQVMYHGTWREFRQFKTSTIRRDKVAMTLWSGPGFYFTDSEKVAKIYAGKAEEERIYCEFLRLENPLVIDETGNAANGRGISQDAAKRIYLDGDNTQWLDSGLAADLARMDEADGVNRGGKYHYKSLTRNERVARYVARLKTDAVILKTAALAYGAKSQEKLLAAIRRHTGHDGVIHQIEPGVKEWVVYAPSAIKSAYGNNGNFETDKAKVQDSSISCEIMWQNVEEKGTTEMVFSSLIDSLSKIVGKLTEDGKEVAMDIVDRHGRHHQPKAIPEGGQYEEEGQYLHGQAKVDAAIRHAGTGKRAAMLREHVAPLYAKLGVDTATRAKIQAMHVDIRGLDKKTLLKGMAKHMKDMKRHADAYNEVKDMGKQEFKEWLDAHPEYRNQITDRLMSESGYNKHYGVKGGYHDDGSGKQRHEAWEEAKWGVGAKAMASMILFQEHADALSGAPDAIMANMIERAGHDEPQVENRAEAAPQEQITASTQEISAANRENVSTEAKNTIDDAIGPFGTAAQQGLRALGVSRNDIVDAVARTVDSTEFRQFGDDVGLALGAAFANGVENLGNRDRTTIERLTQGLPENHPVRRILGGNAVAANRSEGNLTQENYEEAARRFADHNHITYNEAHADELKNFVARAQRGEFDTTPANRTGLRSNDMRFYEDIKEALGDEHPVTQALNRAIEAHLRNIPDPRPADGSQNAREVNTIAEEVGREPRDEAEAVARHVDRQSGAGAPQTFNEHGNHLFWDDMPPDVQEWARNQELGSFVSSDGNQYRRESVGGVITQHEPISSASNTQSNANASTNAPTYTDRDGNTHTIEHNEGGLKAHIHQSEIGAVQAEMRQAFADAGNGVEGAEEYAHALSHFLGRGQDARSPHPGMRQEGLLKHQLAEKMQARLEEKARAVGEAITPEEIRAKAKDYAATGKAVRAIAEKLGITAEMLPDGTNFNQVRTALGVPIRAENPEHQETVNALHALANPEPAREENAETATEQNATVGDPTPAMRDTMRQWIQHHETVQPGSGEALTPEVFVDNINNDDASSLIREGGNGVAANPELADHLEAIRRLPREQQLEHIQRLMGEEPTDGRSDTDEPMPRETDEPTATASEASRESPVSENAEAGGITPTQIHDLAQQIANASGGNANASVIEEVITDLANGRTNSRVENSGLTPEELVQQYGSRTGVSENPTFQELVNRVRNQQRSQPENAPSQNANQEPTDADWQDAERRLTAIGGPGNVRVVLNQMREQGWVSEGNRSHLRNLLGSDHPLTRWAEANPQPQSQEEVQNAQPTSAAQEQNAGNANVIGATHIPDYNGFDQSRVRSSRGRNGFKIPTNIGPTTRIDADLIDNLIHRMSANDQRWLRSDSMRFINFLTGQGLQPSEYALQHAQRQFGSHANQASQAMSRVIGELRMRRSGAVRDAQVAQLTREQKRNVIASDSGLAQRAGLTFNERNIGRVKTAGNGDGKNCYRLSNWAIAQIRGIEPKYIPSRNTLPNANLVNPSEFDLNDPRIAQDGRLTDTGSTLWFAHQQKKMSEAYPRITSNRDAYDKVKEGGNGAIVKMWSGGHSTFLVNDNGQIKKIDSYHRTKEPIFSWNEVSGIGGHTDVNDIKDRLSRAINGENVYDGGYEPIKLLKYRFRNAERKAQENHQTFDRQAWINNAANDFVLSQGSYYIAPDAGLIPELIADIS